MTQAPSGSVAGRLAGRHLLLTGVTGFVGEALRLRELVDLAYDGLAKLLQGERDDAAAKARAAACERRVVGDGAHSDPWATRLPSNARPAAVAHL